jgi:hypothetical protein
MLLCKRNRVTIIPVGGLVLLLALLGFGGLTSLADGGGLSLFVSLGVIGLGIAVHVAMSWIVIRRDDELLRWRGVLARGRAPVGRCRLSAELTPRPGREPMYEVRLVDGDTELLEFASVRQGERGEAQIRAMAEALGLQHQRD